MDQTYEPIAMPTYEPIAMPTYDHIVMMPTKIYYSAETGRAYKRVSARLAAGHPNTVRGVVIVKRRNGSETRRPGFYIPAN